MNQQAQEQNVKCEKGSGEQQTGSRQYLCLSEAQFASQDRLMCVLSLTDEVGDSAAFPIPRREADPGGHCTSETTGRLSEAQSTSPTSAPAESAAGGHLPRHTAQTHPLM